MKHRTLYRLAALALVGNLLIGAIYHRRQMQASGEFDGAAAFRQVGYVTQLVRDNYVDQEKIDYGNLMRGSIQGILAALDPFSSYFPPQDYQEVEEQSHGEFGGIGVIIAMEENTLTVMEPMPGSPGDEAGLQPKDQIIAVNGQPLGNRGMRDSIKLIKGKPGSEVDLTIKRPATREIFDVTIVRAIIEVPTVVDTSYIDEGIGYVRLTQFNEKTAGELEQALMKLSEEQLEGLIIDLRFNPGGLLQAAQHVCSLFLPPGKLVVYTEGRGPGSKQEFMVSNGMKLLQLPVAVVINSSSASASEIVAGCLQDYERATVIGEKSFGKGTVQTPYRLPAGGAIHLTTARYFTPSARVIHGNGIVPDVTIGTENYPDHTPYRAHRGDDEIQDVQLLKALQVLQQQLDRETVVELPEPILTTEPAEADAVTPTE